jgi:hypothetical protein
LRAEEQAYLRVQKPHEAQHVAMDQERKAYRCACAGKHGIARAAPSRIFSAVFLLFGFDAEMRAA